MSKPSLASQDESHLHTPAVSSSKGMVNSQGGPALGNITNGSAEIHAPNLSNALTNSGIDNAITSFVKPVDGNVLQALDEVGNMFGGNINPGAIAPDLQMSEVQGMDLAHTAAPQNLGTKDGVAQGVFGHQQGG